jgi:UDP-N-acetylglucosamine--N-acetylmuramyl-(pentapeptide) pyrophosphoryl-undecaprenol N-acetylglucosamine transferase
MSRSIMIMAGGTGGHIFPALAVADVLRSEGWQVTWLGAPNSMEAELVPKHGYEMALVRFSGLRGNGLVRKLMLPFNLLIAIWQSAVAMFRYRPDVVLGMGGYITFPGGVMAALLRKPLVIHEQNSVAGMSNKALAKIATKVLCGFPDLLNGAEWCGNPVRDSISALPEPEQRYKARNGVLNVLVVGGSLGAKALNECMPQALFCMPQESEPKVIHQTGKKNFEDVTELYAEAGITAELKPFLEDMAHYYAWADVVICRAGALTVAELAAAGVASILVPFPYAVDDHQTGNAKFLSDRGAAILLPQTEMTPYRLAEVLAGITREQAMQMAIKAKNLTQPDAAQCVAKICKELAG